MLIEQLDPRVLIIDDLEKDTTSIQDALKERYVGFKFIDASPDKFKAPEKPFKGVELIFLDLYYNDRFDPEICANILQTSLAPHTNYTLVVWSKDTHQAQEVIDELTTIKLAPYQFLAKQKTDFHRGEDRYDIEQLLNQINQETEEFIKTEELRGEIMVIDEDSVIIDCFINANEHEKIIQLRRFDREPFEKAVDLRVGGYIAITITTKPGSKIFEFSGIDEDLSYLFSKDDLFNDEDLNTYFGK